MTIIDILSIILLFGCGIIYCLFMLYVIGSVHTCLWCVKLYAFIYNKKVYKIYKDILKSNDYKYCNLNEYSDSILNYTLGKKIYNEKFEYSPTTYYLVTDQEAIVQNDNWVINSFWDKLIEDIWKNKTIK